nr:pre-mRNA-splicing factor ATP-dependent RNA helicase DEAH7 isoform X1 [Tanacetum cinerariifolium]
MEVELGDKVGYAILFEDVTGSKTVIMVMIDGDVVDVYISYEKMYALLKMRSVEETQKCDGFGRHFITGDPLKIDQSSLIDQKVVIANVVTLFRKVAPLHTRQHELRGLPRRALGKEIRVFPQEVK